MKTDERHHQTQAVEIRGRPDQLNDVVERVHARIQERKAVERQPLTPVERSDEHHERCRPNQGRKRKEPWIRRPRRRD
jgi:hypothetical protein